MTAPSEQALLYRYPKLLFAGICLLACFVTPQDTEAAGTLEPYPETPQAPQLNLNDTRGEMHRLEDYRGKVVLVNFWASWCPPCVKEMPGLQRLQEYLLDEPFVILPVNVGEKKYRVWKFAKLINFNLPVLLDTNSRTFADWDASVLPTSYLLDAEGHIRYRAQADLEWDTPVIISEIKKLLAEGGGGGE